MDVVDELRDCAKVVTIINAVYQGYQCSGRCLKKVWKDEKI